jgi:hypothetical protein
MSWDTNPGFGRDSEAPGGPGSGIPQNPRVSTGMLSWVSFDYRIGKF